MKNILISGGSSGLGLACVQYFYEKNRVFVFDIHKSDFLDKKNIFYFECDITDNQQIIENYAKIIEKWGQIDVLINCAGINISKKLVTREQYSLKVEDFNLLYKINVLGTFMMIQNFVKNHKNQKSVIINVSSVAAQQGQQGQIGYSMTKGAILSMTLPLARELGQYNIRVVTISPGVFATEMTKILPKPLFNLYKDQSCLNRLGKPSEFAQLCQQIIINDFLTGCNIPLHGGIILPKLQLIFLIMKEEIHQLQKILEIKRQNLNHKKAHLYQLEQQYNRILNLQGKYLSNENKEILPQKIQYPTKEY